MRTALLTALAALALPGFAAATDDAPPPPPLALPEERPQPPAGAPAGEGIEPEVTIIHRKDRTVEEYRVNGRLYMIKVIPAKGAPYYLKDTDGDGDLDTRSDASDLEPVQQIPTWVIFSW